MKLPPPNYTQVPNVVLDAMREIEGSEFAVMMMICRLTFGWHKETVKISLTELEKRTGFSRSGIVKAVKSLEFRGWVHRVKSGQGFEYQVDLELVHSVARQNLPESTQCTSTSATSGLVQAPPYKGKEILKESLTPGAFTDWVKAWCESYLEAFGEKYCFQGAKDGSAVKRGLALGITPEELLWTAKQAWRLSGKLFNCKQSVGLTGFFGRLNEIRAELRSAGLRYRQQEFEEAPPGFQNLFGAIVPIDELESKGEPHG